MEDTGRRESLLTEIFHSSPLLKNKLFRVVQALLNVAWGGGKENGQLVFSELCFQLMPMQMKFYNMQAEIVIIFTYENGLGAGSALKLTGND